MTTSTNPRDRFIPWYFVAFFVFIALTDAVLVTLAVRTQTGMVTKHPYEKGLAYNKVITAADKQAQLGWKGDITTTPTTKQKINLTFTLRDASGKVIPADNVSATLTRVTQDGMDFTVPLKHGAAEITFPLAGLWEVRLYASSNGASYQQSKRIVVQ